MEVKSNTCDLLLLDLPSRFLKPFDFIYNNLLIIYI